MHPGSQTSRPVLLLLALLAATAQDAAAQHTSEADLLSFLTEGKLLLGQSSACGAGVNAELLEVAIQKGWWDATKAMVEACKSSPDRKELEKRIFSAASSVRQRLTEVTNLVRAPAAGGVKQVVPPSFEWAQSPDSIFVNVKFAHKLDAPACIDLVDEALSIEPKEVTLGVSCKNKGKRFELVLPLLKAIDPANSSWVGGSVGRGQLTLLKAVNNTRWPRLLKDREHKPKNMHKWWAMAEKYEKLMKELDRKVEEQRRIEDEDEDAEAAEASKKPKAPIKELTEKQRALKGLRSKAKKRKKAADKAMGKKVRALEAAKKKALAELEGKWKTDKKELEGEFGEKISAAKKAAVDAKEAVAAALHDAMAEVEGADEEAGVLSTLGAKFKGLLDMAGIGGAAKAGAAAENPAEAMEKAEL